LQLIQCALVRSESLNGDDVGTTNNLGHRLLRVCGYSVHILSENSWL